MRRGQSSKSSLLAEGEENDASPHRSTEALDEESVSNDSNDKLKHGETSARKRKSGKKSKSATSESNISDDDESPPEKKRTDSRKSSKKELTPASDADEDSEPESPPKSASKKGTRKKAEELPMEDDEKEFEVEKIVGERQAGGRLQYKIRWKGYSPADDTWENADTVQCQELIALFKKSRNDEPDDHEPSTSRSSNKKNAGRGKKKGGRRKRKENVDPRKEKVAAASEEGEWEVAKIIDMHTKLTGKREFLVRWKGYGPDDDSYVPEEDLHCSDLLDKFLQKLDAAKQASVKNLRVLRKPTNRYTVMSQGDKRRESRRGANKLRKTYYDAE